MKSIQRRRVRDNTKRQGTSRQSDCMKNLVKQIVCIIKMEWMCVFVLCNKCIFGFIINCVIYRVNSQKLLPSYIFSLLRASTLLTITRSTYFDCVHLKNE